MIIRSVQNEGDVAKCAEFDRAFNNEFEGKTYRLLHLHHPTLQWRDSFMAENEATGEIAATICLIPWEFDYEGVPLRVAQLEMVLSHPKYRRQGLMRQLITRFLHNVAAGGYDLSVIWGIPYYYRQFGYGYCLYGDTYVTLSASGIPDAEGSERVYNLRNAGEKDIPELSSCYNAAVSGIPLHVKRNETYWAYLLNDVRQPVRIVEDAQGEAVGYLVCTQSGGGTAHIYEHGVSGYEMGLSVFQMLKNEGYREILVGGPDESVLTKLAKNFGSLPSKPEQWLIQVTHMCSFIRQLSPVLEKHLAGSECAGFTGDVIINLYTQAYRLEFADGILNTVEDLGFKDSSMGADGGDLCIPRDAFIRLLFGFRSLDQLRDAWPDIDIKPTKRHLFDILFPGLAAYIYLPYHQLG